MSGKKLFRKISKPKFDDVVSFRLMTRNFMIYTSSTIVKVMISRRLRWTGHVNWVGNKRKVHRTSAGNFLQHDLEGQEGDEYIRIR